MRPRARLRAQPGKDAEISTILEGEIVPVFQQAESELEAKPLGARCRCVASGDSATTVYRQVNPSVVHIVVSANTGFRACRRRVVAADSFTVRKATSSPTVTLSPRGTALK